MHNNAVAAYAKQVEAQKTNPQAKNDEEVRLINAMKATTPTALLSSIYGVAAPTPISNGLLDYPIDPKTNQEIPSSNSFAFYAAYHLIGSEFLNRAMNVLELMPWNDANKQTLYNFPDTYKYQMGEQNRKLYNADGSWTTDATSLVSLYGKYVYGYDGYGLHIEGNELKGFSKTMFDFVKIDGTAYKVAHINSHYVTKNQIFADPTVIDAPAAFHAVLPASTSASVASKNVEFYVDSNNNNKLDDADQKVTVDFN